MLRINLGMPVAAGLVAFAAGASAADVGAPVYKAPPPPAVSWAGGYIGFNGGVGFATANVDDKDCYNCDSTHTSGFFGVVGGQAGYNWQTRALVYGIEVDGDWASYDRKFVLCANCSGPFVQTHANNATKLDALVSVRGRVGLAYDNVLLYVTGGVAFADMRNNYQSLNSNLTVRDSFVENSWHTGIVGGVGLEAKWSGNWSWRFEWLHYQFETKFVNSTGGSSINQCCQFGFGAQVDVLRVGLNYRLGSAL